MGAAIQRRETGEVANVHQQLNDKQKKAIIARWAQLQNNCEVAREFGVAESTVRRLVKREPGIARVAEEKREQNTRDMLAYMDSEKTKAQGVLSAIMDEMGNPEKLRRAGVRDLATAFGIIVDKFTQVTPQQTAEGNELLKSLYEMEKQV